MCQKKKEKEDLPAWRQRWRIDTNTKRLQRKAWTKTVYSHQKQYWQHENQLNRDNQETKMGKKKTQLCWRFKRLTSDISHEKTWTRLRKGNLKRETESRLIAAQNNTIRTNHIKARIDKTQQSSRCRLCGVRVETINHIISECSQLAQKE